MTRTNPAVSTAQRRLFGVALALKRGRVSPRKVTPAARRLAAAMSERKLREFARANPKLSMPGRLASMVKSWGKQAERVDALYEKGHRPARGEARLAKLQERIEGLEDDLSEGDDEEGEEETSLYHDPEEQLAQIWHAHTKPTGAYDLEDPALASEAARHSLIEAGADYDRAMKATPRVLLDTARDAYERVMSIRRKLRPGRANPSAKKSKGHITFFEGSEFFTGPDGDIYRAPQDRPLDVRGYRQGARFESTPAAWPLGMKVMEMRGWKRTNPTRATKKLRAKLATSDWETTHMAKQASGSALHGEGHLAGIRLAAKLVKGGKVKEALEALRRLNPRGGYRPGGGRPRKVSVFDEPGAQLPAGTEEYERRAVEEAVREGGEYWPGRSVKSRLAFARLIDKMLPSLGRSHRGPLKKLAIDLLKSIHFPYADVLGPKARMAWPARRMNPAIKAAADATRKINAIVGRLKAKLAAIRGPRMNHFDVEADGQKFGLPFKHKKSATALAGILKRKKPGTRVTITDSKQRTNPTLLVAHNPGGKAEIDPRLMRDPKFRAALALFRKRFGEDPVEMVEVKDAPYLAKYKYLVGLGKAPDVSYAPHKKLKLGVGPPFLHRFESKPILAVSPDSKFIGYVGKAPTIVVKEGGIHG